MNDQNKDEYERRGRINKYSNEHTPEYDILIWGQAGYT
jgi:hypothetical protein